MPQRRWLRRSPPRPPVTPENLRAGEVRLFKLAPGWHDHPLRRRFRLPDDSLAITTMGSGAVVSATARWMGWVAELFRDAEPDDAFGPRLLGETSRRVSCDGYRLHGPLLYYVSSSQDWQPHDVPAGYAVEVGGAELVESLDKSDWPNAISPMVPVRGRRNQHRLRHPMADRDRRRGGAQG